MTDPSWLAIARRYIGLKEAVGTANNPKVVELFALAGHPEVKTDSTAWCAAFVGAMLKLAGLKGTGTLWALDFAKWGVPLPGPALGAIAPKRRYDSTGKIIGGHVGIVVGWSPTTISLLGGNQGDAVCIVSYPRSEFSLGFRWPSGQPLPGAQPATLAVAASSSKPLSEA